MEDRARFDAPTVGMLPETDVRLLEQIRSGDAEAATRFVREHYPAIYRYLLYLTGRPEQAEDLTQETFLRAWRYLADFEGRASLRAWLHGIARREFLQALRRGRAEAQLSEGAEVAAPGATAWMEAVELRGVIDRLPLEEREVVLLRYLTGYTSAEIAAIVGAPARTVRRRLEQARERLRQELGEDDLAYLNEPLAPMRQWGWLPLEKMRALEARLGVPTPSVGPSSNASEDMARGDMVRRQQEERMERREFLRHAAVAAVALMPAASAEEVVDSRLTQKVTCAFKATALADLCNRLRTETGDHVTAGPSVADEKVTLFCKQSPLREVMRQLSRPFGYVWLRSQEPEARSKEHGGAAYRYELAQDLRSQLLEEELRNRDRNAALLAADAEMQRYRKFLDLSPDEALARAQTASPEEKKLLEKLAEQGWGPVQMYFRLSSQDLAALRAGRSLTFRQEPGSGEQPLPEDVARGVLQSCRGMRLRRDESRVNFTKQDDPEGSPPAAFPELRAVVTVTLSQSELGQFMLDGQSGFYNSPNSGTISGNGPYAIGRAATPLGSDGSRGHAGPTPDAALRRRVSLQPHSSCERTRAAGSGSHPKVTSADVLEALHRATGLNLVADYYTRLPPADDVLVKEQPLFDALNRISGVLRLRWNKEGEWLQFRTPSYYDDRLKEVPNRLLVRWSEARRQRGALSLDELLEIAQLPDAQLDATQMAEGARECYGLLEWDLARPGRIRPHLRCLAQFTPAQRQSALSSTGLTFAKLPLNQQQLTAGVLDGYIRAMGTQLEELMGASLHLSYTQPGGFGFRLPNGPWKRPLPLLLVQERTWAAALQAARRIDPRVAEAEILPTEPAVTLVYTWGEPRKGVATVVVQSTPAGFRDRFHGSPPASDGE